MNTVFTGTEVSFVAFWILRSSKHRQLKVKKSIAETFDVNSIKNTFEYIFLWYKWNPQMSDPHKYIHLICKPKITKRRNK